MESSHFLKGSLKAGLHFYLKSPRTNLLFFLKKKKPMVETSNVQPRAIWWGARPLGLYTVPGLTRPPSRSSLLWGRRLLSPTPLGPFPFCLPSCRPPFPAASITSTMAPEGIPAPDATATSSRLTFPATTPVTAVGAQPFPFHGAGTDPICPRTS